MTFKARVEDINEVPEEHRTFYSEKEGAWVLGVEKTGDWELVDTHGLLSALSKERASVKELKEKVEVFGSLDPKDAQDAIVKVKEMQNWTPEEKVQGKIDQVKSQLVNQHETAAKALQDKLARREDQLKIVLQENNARQALEKQGAKVELLLPHVMNRGIMEERDGKMVNVIYDNGVEKIKSDGTPYTYEDLVIEMKTQDAFSAGFDGVGASGGGTDKQKKTHRTAGDKVVISEADAKDITKYRIARREADEKKVPLRVEYNHGN